MFFEVKKVTSEREIQKLPKIGKIESVFNILQSVRNRLNLYLSFLLVKVGRISYICTCKAERSLFNCFKGCLSSEADSPFYCVTFGVTLVSFSGKCNFSATFLKVLENLICL